MNYNRYKELRTQLKNKVIHQKYLKDKKRITKNELKTNQDNKQAIRVILKKIDDYEKLISQNSNVIRVIEEALSLKKKLYILEGKK